MLRSILIFLGLWIAFSANSQDLVKSRTTSPYTYFYSVSDRQALRIVRKATLKEEQEYFYIKVDSFPTGSEYQGKLRAGNYLKAFIDKDKIDLEFLSVPNIQLSVIDNQTDLLLRVENLKGSVVEDAEIKIDSRRIPYDKATKSYRLKKANCHGTLTIRYDGITNLMRLDRSYNNPGIKRLSKKIVYGSPVKYVWIPVSTAVVLPVDAAISAIRGYGFYTAKRIWGYISRPFTDGRPVAGFLLFNKPRYNPGDTVMLKAFILRGRNHIPLRKDADIKIVNTNPYKLVKLATIAPYTSGGYSYSFVLSDTLGLRLDKDYPVNISIAGKYRPLVSERFRYEYYDLKSLKLNFNLPEAAHYNGKPFFVSLKAVNENDMVLPDARVTLYIINDKVNEIFDRQVIIRDTLSVIRETLHASGETLIEIPDSIFPDANLDYSIVAVANTSDNESVIETKKVVRIKSNEEIDFKINADSITFFLKVNGDETEKDGVLITEDAFGNQLQEVMIALPFSAKMDPFIKYYTIIAGNIRRTIDAGTVPPGITCITNRINDTVFIMAGSNTGLSFSYFIYELNREVKRGVTDSLDFRHKVSNTKRWYLSLHYLWGGKMNNSLYEIGNQEDKLIIETDQPQLIIPGQQAKITLHVKDYKGNPVSGADITAFSMTRKFGYTLPGIPNLAKPFRRKDLINKFTVAPADDPDLWHPFRFEEWKNEAGLDTVEYFRFRYHPEEVYIFSSDMGDGITQFAPFIFRKGLPVKINHIYLDHRPLYIDIASNNQPYSFRADTGYHFISIRTPDNVYEIDSMRFDPGRKLILSINDTDDPMEYKKEDASPKLTEAEKRRIGNFLMPYRSNFNNTIATISQKDNLLLLSDIRHQISDPDWKSPGYGYAVAGPVLPGKVHFESTGKFQTDFDFESCYEYDFAPGLLKMRSFDPNERVPSHLTSSGKAEDLKNSVLTQDYLDSVRMEILKARARTSYNYTRNEKTRAGNGSVQILKSNETEGRNPVANILFSESLRSMHTKRGLENYINNVSPGLYSFIAFYDEGDYQRIDSVNVIANGKTYLDISSVKCKNDPDLFNRVVEMISFSDGINRQMTSDERQLLQEFTRQEVKQYEGPGYTVSGTVVDSDENEPLPGVTVSCNRPETGVITDINGHYSIKLPYGVNILTFNFIGMKSQEYEVASDQTLDVVMEADLMALDEVVVVGYGMSKSSLTASSVSVTESLQGSVAGVEITNDRAIQIRGMSTISGDGPPLIIIDGAPYTGDLSFLDPEMMKSIRVLKDPSLISLYGSRAANGVIFLTTKPGGVIVSASDKGVSFDDSFIQQAMESGSLRKNFRDYAYWQPTLQTDAGGKVSFTATFPDDITSWETFAVAINGSRQAGAASGIIKAFRPVIAQLASPKYFTVGDSVNLIGKIINYTSKPASLSERFICNGDTLISRQRILNDAIIDTMPVMAGKSDSLRLEFSFTSGTGLKDGEYRPIPVNEAGLRVDSGRFMILERDTSFTIDLGAFSDKVTLTAMAGPLEVLQKNNYRLINYVYSCNEQMSSKLIGLLSAETINKALGKENRSDYREAVRLIRNLSDNRNEEGLWGWWGRSGTEEWISIHVIEALMMAREQGYSVTIDSDQLIDNAILILESASPDLLSSRLSLLEILSKIGARVDFNRYLKNIGEEQNLSFHDSLRITALSQKYKLPADLAYIEKARQKTVFGSVFFIAGGDHHSVTDNNLMTTLLVYKILRSDSTQTIADLNAVRNYFLESMTFGEYFNTFQSASIINTILGDVAGNNGSVTGTSMELHGQATETTEKFPFVKILQPVDSLNIIKKGSMPLFLHYSQTVFRKAPTADSTDFRVITRWSPSEDNIKSGVPVKVVAEIEFCKSADYLVIEIPVPSGFTFLSRESVFPGEEHREFYRDHVAIFIRHAEPGKRSFEVELMPRYSGKFVHNPSKVSLMYFPSIYSNDTMREITIN